MTVVGSDVQVEVIATLEEKKENVKAQKQDHLDTPNC